MSSILKNYFLNYSENKFLKKLKPLADYSKVITRNDMGRGVELLEPIKAGTLVGIYPGAHVSVNAFLEKEDFVTKSVKSAYLHNDTEIIDPTDIFGFVPDQPKLRIALINEPPENEVANIIAVSSNKHVWYVAIANIEAGKQLYTNYGELYERSYRSGKLKLSLEQLKCLKAVANKHCWLKDNLKLICEDIVETI